MVLIFKTPRRSKYAKTHTSLSYPSRRISKGGFTLHTGEFALKAVTAGRMTGSQYEAARRTVSRVVKKFCDVHLPVFPQIAITSKAVGVRMGGGKGKPEVGRVAVIEDGRILIVLSGNITKVMAHQALKAASYKFPFETKIIGRIEGII